MMRSYANLAAAHMVATNGAGPTAGSAFVGLRMNRPPHACGRRKSDSPEQLVWPAYHDGPDRRSLGLPAHLASRPVAALSRRASLAALSTRRPGG